MTFDQWAEYNFGKECSMKYQNLTKFLPCFAEGQSGGKWQGGKQADRQVIMPYVAYNEKIEGFIQEFSRSELADRDYGEKMDARGWWDEVAMDSATVNLRLPESFIELKIIDNN